MRRTADQLVVDVELVLGGGVNFGWRLAQAASAFWTDALFVLSVVDVLELVPEDPLGNVTPWSFRQLRYAVRAALEKPPGLVPNPFGRRLAQAASAFWTDALFVLSVVDVVEPEDPLGNVTPWSFRQLRYAAEAALEKPPGLVPNPFGRRLAHAADAFWNAGELKLVATCREAAARREAPACRASSEPAELHTVLLHARGKCGG